MSYISRVRFIPYPTRGRIPRHHDIAEDQDIHLRAQKAVERLFGTDDRIVRQHAVQLDHRSEKAEVWHTGGSPATLASRFPRE